MTKPPGARAPAVEVTCESVEECEIEAVESYDQARSMYREAKALRSSARHDEASLARARAEAARSKNNILPLAAKARSKLVSVWRTTLKLAAVGDAAGRDAFCRAAWTFLPGNRAAVAVTPSKSQVDAVVGSDAGWRLHVTPQTVPDYRHPDLLECWCWVTRRDSRTREKVTLRTTCMPVDDAETALAAEKAAKGEARAVDEHFASQQAALETEANWLRRFLAWNGLFRTFEDREVKQAVKQARADLAKTVSGYHVVLDGKTYALGAVGNYVVDGDDAAPAYPNPVASALARFLPATMPRSKQPVGLFTTWRD
jgi:hypothetical protein